MLCFHLQKASEFYTFLNVSAGVERYRVGTMNMNNTAVPGVAC